MATPNYAYEKRQRELAKKRKKEEKAAAKKPPVSGGYDAYNRADPPEPAASGTGTDPGRPV